MTDVPRPVTEFSVQVLGTAWPLQSESAWSAGAERLRTAAHQLWAHAAGPQFDLTMTLASMSGAYIDAAIAVVRQRQTILENRAKGYQFAGQQAGAVAARILTVKNRLEGIVYHTEATVTAARNELEPQIVAAAAGGNAALALALAAELQDRIETAVAAGRAETQAEDVEGAGELEALHAALTAWQPPYEVPAAQTPTAAPESAPASSPAATPNAQLAAHRSVGADQSATAGPGTASAPGRVQSTAFQTDPGNRPQPALSRPATPSLPEQSSPGFGTLHEPAAATPSPAAPRAAAPTPRPTLSPTPAPALPPAVASGTGPGIAGSLPGGAMPGPGLALPSAPMGPGAISALTGAASAAAAPASPIQALAHVEPTEPPPPAHLAAPPPVQPPAEPKLHSLIPPADPAPAPATAAPAGPSAAAPQPAAPAEPAPSGAGSTGGAQSLGAANLAAGLLLPPPPPPPPPATPPVTPPPPPAAKALPLHTEPPPQQDPTPDHRDDTVHPLDYAVDSVKDANDVIKELERLRIDRNSPVVDTLPELEDMFRHLTENGTLTPLPTWPDSFVLKDGTRITWRNWSKSGSETISIKIPNEDGERKIHIADHDKKKPKPQPAPVQVPAEEPAQEPVHQPALENPPESSPNTHTRSDPGILERIGDALITAGVIGIVIIGGAIAVIGGTTGPAPAAG